MQAGHVRGAGPYDRWPASRPSVSGVWGVVSRGVQCHIQAPWRHRSPGTPPSRQMSPLDEISVSVFFAELRACWTHAPVLPRSERLGVWKRSTLMWSTPAGPFVWRGRLRQARLAAWPLVVRPLSPGDVDWGVDGGPCAAGTLKSFLFRKTRNELDGCSVLLLEVQEVPPLQPFTAEEEDPRAHQSNAGRRLGGVSWIWGRARESSLLAPSDAASIRHCRRSKSTRCQLGPQAIGLELPSATLGPRAVTPLARVGPIWLCCPSNRGLANALRSSSGGRIDGGRSRTGYRITGARG